MGSCNSGAFGLVANRAGLRSNAGCIYPTMSILAQVRVVDGCISQQFIAGIRNFYFFPVFLITAIVNVAQAGTSQENIPINRRYTGRDMHFSQIRAIFEGIAGNAGHTFGNFHLFNLVIMAETGFVIEVSVEFHSTATGNLQSTVTQQEILNAIVQAVSATARTHVNNGSIKTFGTILLSIAGNGGNIEAIPLFHGSGILQLDLIIGGTESTFLNMGHRDGDCDVFQIRECSIKCPFADAGKAIWQFYTGDRAGIAVEGRSTIIVIRHATGTGNDQTSVIIQCPVQIRTTAAAQNTAIFARSIPKIMTILTRIHIVNGYFGQRLIIVTNRNFIPLLLCTTVVYIGQFTAVIESLFVNAIYTFRNRNTDQIGTYT